MPHLKGMSTLHHYPQRPIYPPKPTYPSQPTHPTVAHPQAVPFPALQPTYAMRHQAQPHIPQPQPFPFPASPVPETLVFPASSPPEQVRAQQALRRPNPQPVQHAQPVAPAQQKKKSGWMAPLLALSAVAAALGLTVGAWWGISHLQHPSDAENQTASAEFAQL